MMLPIPEFMEQLERDLRWTEEEKFKYERKLEEKYGANYEFLKKIILIWKGKEK